MQTLSFLWGYAKLGQVFLRVSYSSSICPSIQNAACCDICMWEKKSENVAIYPKHIWESRRCISWATTAGVTGAYIPHDWIQVCSAFLRHKREPQIGQSNISALLESSSMWLELCRALDLQHYQNRIHPLSFITHLTQPPLLGKFTTISVLLWAPSDLCQNHGRLHGKRKRTQGEVHYSYYLS